MPKSNIDPEVVYDTVFTVNPEDANINTELYEIILNELPLIIAIGQPVYDFKDYGIVYMPIYVMKTNKLFVQIGLYELLISDTDPAQSVRDTFLKTPHLINPLIYPGITRAVLSAISITRESLITDNPQTPNMNDPITPRPSWVSEYMSDTGYDIIDNEGGGHCLFAVLRDGLASVGRNISVDEMRHILSETITDDHFQNHKSLYDAHSTEIRDLETQRGKIFNSLKTLKADAAKLPKEQRKDILKQFAQEKELLSKIKSELAIATEAHKNEFGYMNGVTSINDMKRVVQTPVYWADAWAISMLEKELNVKLILLSSVAYKAGQIHNVITCGVSIDATQFTPDYYIITDYSGNHYELITYNGKRAFTFTELPPVLVQNIARDCLKGETGAYNIISDFNSLKP